MMRQHHAQVDSQIPRLARRENGLTRGSGSFAAERTGAEGRKPEDGSSTQPTRGAARQARPLTEGTALDKRRAEADLSPLVAVELAVWQVVRGTGTHDLMKSFPLRADGLRIRWSSTSFTRCTGLAPTILNGTLSVCTLCTRGIGLLVRRTNVMGISTAPHFETIRAGRDHLKDVMDAAEEGRPTSVVRDHTRAAVVDADRLVYFLRRLQPANAEVVAENGGWSIFIPGLPIAADGDTLDEALDEMVDALRDYAEAWADRLRLAPNHSDNWGLVQIITFSSDEQLKYWLQGR
jgi:predicted RNase H-like HicB family nuclease